MASIARFLHKTSTFHACPGLCQISMCQPNLDERNWISVPNARKEGSCNLDLSLASSISPVLRSRQVLCKAEANISSGNVPKHAPEKLSLYERKERRREESKKKRRASHPF